MHSGVSDIEIDQVQTGYGIHNGRAKECQVVISLGVIITAGECHRVSADIHVSGEVGVW